jgi:hypothetical protein
MMPLEEKLMKDFDASGLDPHEFSSFKKGYICAIKRFGSSGNGARVVSSYVKEKPLGRWAETGDK